MLSKDGQSFKAKELRYLKALILVVSVCFVSFSAFPAVPTAKDDSVEVSEDSSITISVLDNDQDVASNPTDREITIIQGPDHGSVSVENDTKVDYAPEKDFHGRDSFVYRIANLGDGSSEAKVTIEVNPENDPPIPVKDLFTTRQGTSVTVKLSATDKDIDPLKPQLHPVEFKILSGPFHGKLIGDVGSVVFYKSPHEVFVEFEYVPNPDFRGMDSITYQVKDKEEIVNISSVMIDVISETAPPVSFAGYWATSTTFEENSTDYFSDFGTDLTAIYRYGEVEVRSDMGWSMTGWNSLKISTALPLGGLELETTLDFDPEEDDPFNYWKTEAAFYYSEMDYEYTFNLDRDSEDIYHELQARWYLNNVSFRGTTKFTGADPRFGEATLRTRWSPSDFDLSVNTDLSFTDKGFDEFAVDVGDIPLFFDIYFGFETTFTPDSKEIKPDLSFRSDLFDCIRLKTTLETNGAENKIEGLSITGLSLSNDFPGGIELRLDFSFDSAFDEGSNVSTELGLSGPFYAGYEAPGRWRLTTNLGSEDNGQLFGWEDSKLKVIAPLSESLNIETIITWRSQTPRWGLVLGGEIFW